MEILIDNRQKKFRVTIRTIKRKVQAVLNDLGCHDREISIVITDDPGIQELNRQYLDRDRPTNVIAFSMQEGDFAHIANHLLGDVVISADTAAAEAEAAGMDFSDRFDQLIIHGILHLLGYDHETDAQAAAVMDAKSDALFRLIQNPETNFGNDEC